jgi:TetR/AcrR family transcriptional regulator, tetracycline repressor protein
MGTTERVPLTDDRICVAALRLIDEHGLDALSMRRLGTELGVDPMAVYRHIPGKDELLKAIVRRVFAQMPVPADTGPWTVRVHHWAHAYRSVAQAHPNLVLRIVTEPAVVAVAAVQANEALYRALELSGLRPADIASAADVIVDFVNGSVLADVTGDTDVDAAALFLAELDARPDDDVAAQRRVFAGDRLDESRNSFDFGLDIIMAGLESLSGR